MKKVFLFSSIMFLSAFAILSCNKPVPDPEPEPAKIVINEAYSNGGRVASDGTNYGDLDWVELYNDGDLEGDVSGWILYDKEDKAKFVTLPESTKIASHGFFLVYVDVEGGFGLSSDGDQVFLEDAAGVVIDHIEFGALTPDHAHARKPDGSATFAIQKPTPNASNNNVVANPVISNLTQTPLSPTNEDVVTITMQIEKGDGELTSYVLSWKVDDAEQLPIELEMSGYAIHPPMYNVQIPAQAAGAMVEYRIIASNSTGGQAELGSSYTVRDAAYVDYTGLVINEVDGNGKFVELYNNSANAISLAGVTLVKNESSTWWSGGEVYIAAGGFYTIAQTGEEAATDNAATEYAGASGISAKKTVKFELKKPDGTTIIDEFARVKADNILDADCAPNYSKSTPYSFSRCPNGTGNFGLAVPSCNSTNPATAAGVIVTTD
jgi:hypothetical protein